MNKPHPCLSCGACCATFRVSFYWAEPVPEEYTEKLTNFYACMKGTNEAESPRCVALGGTLGESVACGIYENRPTPCRSFEASLENGEVNERCDRARVGKGLLPLTPDDWLD
jgi:Fe-S-cluster containining protein